MKTICKILKRIVNTKKVLCFLTIALTTLLITNLDCYCQNSDSLTAYPMPNGYFYPKKEVKGFIGLIAEGVQARKKLLSEERRTRVLDSLLINSYRVIDNQKNENTRLRIDSSFHKKEVDLYKNFSNDFVKPFVSDFVNSNGKKEKKVGFIIGGLFASTVFLLILNLK